ncbi:MAG: 30S ribosomal protein S2 [Desulfurococcales archaeon]|nr:30S ribosomal protein S2 [Desulfurococcales archaeon]
MSDQEQTKTQEEFLVPLEIYRKAGVFLGTHICTKYMEQFVYKIRPDGLYILDIRKIDERLRIASKFLSNYDPEKIAVVAVRQYGQKPVKMMCERVGCKSITGRVTPGIFTNPKLEWYMEPDVVLVTDPRAEAQAIKEAFKVGIPIVALTDTDNRIENIDLIIPVNNKGRKSLALVYWILTREILRNRGIIGPDQDLDVTWEDYIVRPVRK